MNELPPAPEQERAQEESSKSNTDPKNIRRDTENAYVAGVAAGLGRHFGVDPNIVRVGLVISVFFGGLGLVAYMAGWIILPADDAIEGEDIGDRFAANWPWLLLGGFAVSVVGGLGNSNDGSFGWGVLGLVLIAIGIYLVASQRNGSSKVTLDDLGESAKSAGQEVSDRLNSYKADRQQKKEKKKPWSPLGSITTGVMLIVGAVLIYLNRSGQLDMTVQQIIGIELIVVAVGALIGTFFGRTRDFLTWIPVFMILVLGFGSQSLQAGFADRTYTPASVSDLQSKYELGAGTLTIDLRRVDVPRGETVDIETSLGAGKLVILVPRDERIDASGQVGLGKVELLDISDDGPGASANVHSEDTEAGGAFRIDARNGVGEITMAYSEGSN